MGELLLRQRDDLGLAAGGGGVGFGEFVEGAARLAALAVYAPIRNLGLGASMVML